MTLKKIKGTEGRDTLIGGNPAEWLIGLGGNDKLFGFDGNDLLDGGLGNDRLDGGLGNDTMKGGLGNDTYVVGELGDVVHEKADEGTDTVSSAISYTLGANVERLVLTGSGNIDAAGNKLANIITGNDGNNEMDGAGGSDRLVGKGGDDLYSVEDLGDRVVEKAGGGNDWIYTHLSLTLGANVENLWMMGGDDLTGTGNGLDNTIYGNDGNNTLDGGLGADTMASGMGNDTYVVDNIGDLITENFLEGTDTVLASVSYTIGANVENLTLTGSDAIDGHGNADANVLTGNDAVNSLYADNEIDGWGGGDTLYGGGGNDILYSGDGDNVLDGGAGAYDAADYSLLSTWIRFTVTSSMVVYKSDSHGSDTLTNIEEGHGGSAGDEFLISNEGFFFGGGGADTLRDQVEGDGLYGQLYGEAGNDVMKAGADGGFLNGGTDSDRLFATGGAGAVMMVGGSGADQFYLQISNSGGSAGKLTCVVTINDFEDGTDHLAFYGYGEVDTADEMYAALVAANALSDGVDGLHIAPGGGLSDTVIEDLTMATFSSADIYMANT